MALLEATRRLQNRVLHVNVCVHRNLQFYKNVPFFANAGRHTLTTHNILTHTHNQSFIIRRNRARFGYSDYPQWRPEEKGGKGRDGMEPANRLN